MKVLMITDHRYEPDIRIRREAEGLVEEGHEVHVACRGEYEDDRHYSLNGVDVTRICTDSKIIWHIAERVYAATWINPVWWRIIDQLLERENFDLVYYHDIDHAKLATKLADRYELPLLADLHEMYPQAVKMWREGSSLRERIDLRRLLTLPIRYQRLERFAVENADALVTVSEELREYFEERYDCSDIPTGVVRNVPDLERLDDIEIEHLGYDDEFVISYIGGFTPQRGIEIAINAMPDVLEEVPEAKLVLVGDGNDNYVESLQELVRELGISDSVEFTGWVDFEKVPSYYVASDVSLCPLTDNPASRYALPNKIFQAMAFRTPILASDRPTMRRILSETGAGVTVEDHPEGFSNALIELANDRDDLQDMGANGRQAVETRYNIDFEMADINQIIEDLFDHS